MQVVRAQRPVGVDFQIAILEQAMDGQGVDLPTVGFRFSLDHLAELDLQPARQADVVIPLQHISHTALARLTVDAHHFLVAATNIERVDGQIGDIPDLAILAAGQTLADGILMTAGEGGEHQFAGIRVPRMGGNLGAGLNHLGDLRHARQIQCGINALGVKVHGHGHQVHVAGTLAVTHQGTFDPVGSRHHRQLGRGHGATAIVVGMHTDADVFTALDVVADPLNLVGEHIRCRHFNGGRQVDDHRLPLFRTPHLAHGINHFRSEIQLGTGKAFRRILEGPLGLRVTRGDVANQFGTVDGNIPDAIPIQAKYLLPLNCGGRVVDMHDCFTGTSQGFICAFDQLRAGLGQHLYLHILGDAIFFNQLAAEIEIRLAGSGKTDLDFLEAQLDQQLEHPRFLGDRHGLHERLVAIPEIHGTPGGRLLDDLVRPATVSFGNRFERNVFAMIESHACDSLRFPE